MLVVGIETSCDETACAVVENGTVIRANVISSQVDLHNRFGGVVPELASRRHIEIIDKVLDKTLEDAQCAISDIDLIAVTKGPGLIGALLVGLNFAKGLAFAKNIPLLGINHIEAHLYAAMMNATSLRACFPALGLVLSGGHTSMVLINDIGQYRLLAETADDAIGEAFDKVAKILELPYPGGPEIERLAMGADSAAFSFHKSHVKGYPLAFSFSGIKTRMLYTVRDLKGSGPLTQEQKKNLAASFQEAVCQDIISKTCLAMQQHPVKSLILGGGVTANGRLRTLVQETIQLPVFWPQEGLCMDNAAMLAGLAYHKYRQQPRNELLTLEPETRMPF